MDKETMAIELQALKATVEAAQETWPHLSDRIRNGAMLAAAGYAYGAPNEWAIKKTRQLKGDEKRYYIVTIDNTKPPRWQCNCLHQGDTTGEFLLGFPGSICKHIAAAALANDAQLNLKPAKDELEIIDRLIEIQVFPHMPGIKWQIAPGLNLTYSTRYNGVILTKGRVLSKRLVHRIITDEVDQRGDLIQEWVKVETFQVDYEEFAERVAKKL